MDAKSNALGIWKNLITKAMQQSAKSGAPVKAEVEIEGEEAPAMGEMPETSEGESDGMSDLTEEQKAALLKMLAEG